MKLSELVFVDDPENSDIRTKSHIWSAQLHSKTKGTTEELLKELKFRNLPSTLDIVTLAVLSSTILPESREFPFLGIGSVPAERKARFDKSVEIALPESSTFSDRMRAVDLLGQWGSFPSLHRKATGSKYDARILREDLSTYLRNQKWEKILPAIEEVISDLESGRTSSMVDLLILANISAIDIVRGNEFLQDVLRTLSVYLKDVKVLSELGKTHQALELAKRAKQIIELADALEQAAKEEGLTPLQSSDIVKVDEVGGRPVFTLKE